VRLATFTESGRTRIGVIEHEEIADLSCEAGLPTEMIALLEGGTPALTAVRSAVRTARRLPLSMVRLEAPVLRPRKFLGLGGSYESHLAGPDRSGDEKPLPPVLASPLPGPSARRPS